MKTPQQISDDCPFGEQFGKAYFDNIKAYFVRAMRERDLEIVKNLEKIISMYKEE